jgi:hypothetical protein
MNQDKLLYQIAIVALEVSQLNLYIERLDEEYITKEDIRDEIPVMEHDFDVAIEKLIQLRYKTKELMEHYSND